MRLRTHIAVLGVMGVLVAWQTWPLARDAAHLLPPHHDPYLFGWATISVARNLAAHPTALFEGNALYPLGSTLAFSEPLLTSGVVAAPIFGATGDPILAYNLTLLLFWVLSGWAMYAATYWLTRHHGGALVAALVFTLSPYRTDYYLEFQMELIFGLPLAVCFFLRFVQRQRLGDLGVLLAIFWLQAAAVWYYAIITAGALAIVGLAYVLLRWRGWRLRTSVAGVAGVLLLAGALYPLAEPYFAVRRELAIERGLEEAAQHSADVLTYLESGPSWLYRFSPTGSRAESALFLGFLPLALAGVGLLGWGIPRGRGLRVLAAVAAASTGAAAALAIWGPRASSPIGESAGPAPAAIAASVLFVTLLAMLGTAGWRRHRAGLNDRALGGRELAAVLAALGTGAFLLSLGPMVYVNRVAMGTGPYAWLYPVLLPLHAVRVASRFGALVVFAVGLLAALGVARLDRWVRRAWRPAVWAAVSAVIVVEYTARPLAYDRVSWDERPAVYRALEALNEDVSLIEVPFTAAKHDTPAMFYSIGHRKRVVNGFSGFVPRATEAFKNRLGDRTPAAWDEVRQLVGELEPEALLLVHFDRLSAPQRAHWHGLRTAPWARLMGRYGESELYRVVTRPRGGRIEKLFSAEFARGRREVAFRARPIGPVAAGRWWLDVGLNGRVLRRIDLPYRGAEAVVPLEGPLNRVAPNSLTFTVGYPPWRDAERHAIGRSGVVSPVDLTLLSVGDARGGRAAVLVNGGDLAFRHRGFNVVALTPDGSVAARAVFDTSGWLAESDRLAAFVSRLPAGSIVAVAVNGHVTRYLTAEAREALGQIGARVRLPTDRALSYTLVGVKGAASGSCLERVGTGPVQLTLGEHPSRVGVVLERFDIR